MVTAAENCWNLTKNNIPGVLLGYHNKRQNLVWGSDYSVKLAIDALGPNDVAAGLDLTIHTDAEMEKRSKYLRDACLAGDPRTKYIREWIGTVNSSTVSCYIHDSETQAFRFDGSRDLSHLWHIHISFFRKYAGDPEAGRAIASILNGETYAQYTGEVVDNDVAKFILYQGGAYISFGCKRRAIQTWDKYQDYLRVYGAQSCYPAADSNGFPSEDLANRPGGNNWTLEEVNEKFGPDEATLTPPPVNGLVPHTHDIPSYTVAVPTSVVVPEGTTGPAEPL
jgi:hypothetical protein